MEKIIRLQVEVPQAVMAELEGLMEIGGLKTKKDLLNTAFTLLRWAVREKVKGNAICSVNEQSLLRKELEMPFLEFVAIGERARSHLCEGPENGNLDCNTDVQIDDPKEERVGTVAAASSASSSSRSPK